MKSESKTILVAALVSVLAACGVSSQSDVDQAAHDRDAAVAKARQDAQPSVDAANRDVAKAQDQADAQVSDAHATADREVGEATVKQTREQSKANYDVVVARANGDLAVALEKCKVQSGNSQSACERDANQQHDQAIDAAKATLDIADRQTD
jgi:hypothetical protein